MTNVEFQVWASADPYKWGHVVNSHSTLEKAQEAAKQVKAAYKRAGSKGLTIRILRAKTEYFELQEV